MSAVIASTVRGVENSIESFVDYHLGVGFEHVYLFLDDPEERIPSGVVENSSVTIVPVDGRVREQWNGLNVYQSVQPFIETEVMARQQLNCELAMRMAQERGYDWLMHLDADELLFSRHGSIVSCFERASEKNLDMLSFINHEAMPEKVEVEDCFKEVTLFKKNAHVRDPENFNQRVFRFSQEQADVIGRSEIDVHFPYFLYYAGRKSAVNLRVSMIPDGVHAFRSCVKPENELAMEFASDDYALLHYACCGLDTFELKYRMLGNFSDHWFGHREIGKEVPFHIAARNLFASGKVGHAKEFYRRYVMQENMKLRKEMLACGALERIELPARLLGVEPGKGKNLVGRLAGRITGLFE